jgi:hypothetical protein
VFRIPRINVIESDEGFSVEVLGLTGIKYTENKKALNIDSELLAGPSGLGIYKDSIKTWNFPHSKKIIDEAERERIVDNIKRAFKFRGFEIQVI